MITLEDWSKIVTASVERQMAISNLSVEQLREAAFHWRDHDRKISAMRRFLWFGPAAPNDSLYDRIDEMIDEIERLRAIISSRGASGIVVVTEKP